MSLKTIPIYLPFDGEKAVELISKEKTRPYHFRSNDAKKKNGIDVCREVRMESNVPIIMLTAKGEEIDRILGLELGADDYIIKPI